jgi:hypothetical protein
MTANQAVFPLHPMARMLGVSASGYYAWRNRPPSARARSDTAGCAASARSICTSQGTSGAPRVLAALRAAGIRIGEKRTARLRRATGIAGISRRARPAPRSAIARADQFPIPSTATSRSRGRTACGGRTSPASRPGPACSTSRRFSMPGRGHRRLGLLAELGDEDRTGRARHGADRASAGRGHSPQRPRLAVHRYSLRHALPREGRAALHGLGRRCLRQRHVRELLRHLGMRTARTPSLPLPRRGQDRRLRLHRGLLQRLVTTHISLCD